MFEYSIQLEFASIPFNGKINWIWIQNFYIKKVCRLKMINRYEMIIYWSDVDQSFVVEVPELPGCMADGATYQDAVANAEIVINEWIETAQSLGRPIPQPKGKLMYA